VVHHRVTVDKEDNGPVATDTADDVPEPVYAWDTHLEPSAAQEPVTEPHEHCNQPEDYGLFGDVLGLLVLRAAISR